MRDYFVFGNINALDYGIYAANKNQFEGAGKRIEIIQIPGRNGTLGISDGTFENINITYETYIKSQIEANIAGLRGALGSISGYARLADSFEPDIFMKARYVEPFTVKGSDRKSAAIDISFDCDPRRFLKSGERAKTYTSASQLKNPTRYEALPLIRAYGIGTLTVSGTAITITAANEYTDIDSETEEAYKGASSCNNNIILTNGEFPSLKEGLNEISFTGLSKVEITPRWWTR